MKIAVAVVAMLLAASLLVAPPTSKDKVILGANAAYGTADGAAIACSRDLRKGEKRVGVEDSCVYVRRYRNGERTCAIGNGARFQRRSARSAAADL